jgi:hypothetical protein
MGSGYALEEFDYARPVRYRQVADRPPVVLLTKAARRPAKRPATPSWFAALLRHPPLRQTSRPQTKP